MSARKIDPAGLQNVPESRDVVEAVVGRTERRPVQNGENQERRERCPGGGKERPAARDSRRAPATPGEGGDGRRERRNREMGQEKRSQANPGQTQAGENEERESGHDEKSRRKESGVYPGRIRFAAGNPGHPPWECGERPGQKNSGQSEYDAEGLRKRKKSGGGKKRAGPGQGRR
jgi:hypothetical protein